MIDAILVLLHLFYAAWQCIMDGSGLLWILDTCGNIAMEPFRAFVMISFQFAGKPGYYAEFNDWSEEDRSRFLDF
jgi:hypothetical protein